jgi:hypothetical protein
MFEWHRRFSEETGDVEYEEQHCHPVLMKIDENVEEASAVLHSLAEHPSVRHTNLRS